MDTQILHIHAHSVEGREMVVDRVVQEARLVYCKAGAAARLNFGQFGRLEKDLLSTFYLISVVRLVDQSEGVSGSVDAVF